MRNFDCKGGSQTPQSQGKARNVFVRSFNRIFLRNFANINGLHQKPTEVELKNEEEENVEKTLEKVLEGTGVGLLIGARGQLLSEPATKPLHEGSGLCRCTRKIDGPPRVVNLPFSLSWSTGKLYKYPPCYSNSYVVYLGGHSHDAKPSSCDLERATKSHYELLGSLLGSKEKAKDAIFDSYTKVINGFAANLEEEEATEIAKHSSVLSVFPNRARELHTTHSWDFLGLARQGNVPMRSLWRKARFGEGVIIGNIDSGGCFTRRASVFGHGMGTAAGGAPKAHVAAYKACWPDTAGGSCYDSDILAAFDHAIHDGVDVISASLGGLNANFFQDAISVGSFHALKHGIVVVCSAGNKGAIASVMNPAPWIFTVAASTIDRKFDSLVLLGNKRILKGQSLSSSKLPAKKLYPLITSTDARAAMASMADAYILACSYALWVLLILRSETMGDDLAADPHMLPASHISATDGKSVLRYINSTKLPVVYITYPKTKKGTKPAPTMAAFSSMGPNPIAAEILKPDIAAPGENIIAAFTEAVSPSAIPSDSRRAPFSAMSGTSMSCPHVAGIAALLKAAHPDWSPAAIRSAMMTTARIQDNMRKPMKFISSMTGANPFSYGAGFVQPNRAMDPGLVYDLKVGDYLRFVCALGYNRDVVAHFKKNFRCPNKTMEAININYPSITIPKLSGFVKVTRTLKNVGPKGTYKVRVHEPEGISVKVEPKSLTFDQLGVKKKFSLLVKPKNATVDDGYVFGKITWSDGVHHVRSPLVVRNVH
ncbi:hypothetical protein HPP92_021283 [Vanilla planifolia]|uniref:Uncharacterized protein n=1 Tax=Vanilla planifolia TaxID=51239 RepID=A0A835Q7P0_VANPL|nr:hypothetical protein HPP92_021283 [Vanilla planifolia]